MPRRYKGDDEGHGAGLFLYKEVFKELVKLHPRLKSFEDEYRYGNDEEPVRIPIRACSLEMLQSIRDVLRKYGRKYGGMIGTVSSHLRILEGDDSEKITKLPQLETAIVKYLKKDIIEGWFFRAEAKKGTVEPLQVEAVKFHPPRRNNDGTVDPAYVSMSLSYWERGSERNETISWDAKETVGKTVAEVLREGGYVHETKELVDLYNEGEEQFLKWRTMLGEQFLGNGAFEAKDDSWRRGHASQMHNNRLVIDDRCDSVKHTKGTQIFNVFNEEGDVVESEEKDYYRLPLVFDIWCFHLDSHQGGWVHMDSIKPYVYRPEIREKLILPADHSNLIEALTGDMDVLMQDIVSGKSGGTVIICQGKAGTGKTLTAEVYAEVAKRPLYRFHSGQLGITAESVEEALKGCLDNSKRWRAITLIDEADVFLKQRGDSLEQNAVCGVFLRLLEYYDGILFLTTNRLDAIDDAILSRCIAQIKYEAPAEAERVKLWHTLGEVYELKLTQSDKECLRLAQLFEEATGRDIKGLIRLTLKYCRQRGREPSFDDVARMAVFRGFSLKGYTPPQEPPLPASAPAQKLRLPVRVRTKG